MYSNPYTPQFVPPTRAVEHDMSTGRRGASPVNFVLVFVVVTDPTDIVASMRHNMISLPLIPSALAKCRARVSFSRIDSPAIWVRRCLRFCYSQVPPVCMRYLYNHHSKTVFFILYENEVPIGAPLLREICKSGNLSSYLGRLAKLPLPASVDGLQHADCLGCRSLPRASQRESLILCTPPVFPVSRRLTFHPFIFNICLLWPQADVGIFPAIQEDSQEGHGPPSYEHGELCPRGCCRWSHSVVRAPGDLAVGVVSCKSCLFSCSLLLWATRHGRPNPPRQCRK